VPNQPDEIVGGALKSKNLNRCGAWATFEPCYDKQKTMHRDMPFLQQLNS